MWWWPPEPVAAQWEWPSPFVCSDRQQIRYSDSVPSALFPSALSLLNILNVIRVNINFTALFQSVPRGSQLNGRTLKWWGFILIALCRVKSEKTDQNKPGPQVVQNQKHTCHIISSADLSTETTSETLSPCTTSSWDLFFIAVLISTLLQPK